MTEYPEVSIGLTPAVPFRGALVLAMCAAPLLLTLLLQRDRRPTAPVAYQLYVAPDGRPDAAGSLRDPLDLPSVLARGAALPPGSSIWLLGGTYGDGNSFFITRFHGTADNPIVVRQYPGARATLNGCLIAEGSHTWFRDFEVLSTISDRTGSRYNPASGTLDGVVVNGPYTRLIHLAIHDTREGIALWTPAVGAEVHDCLIYNNGWQGPDRGHGHGIYTQNRDGPKTIAGNIIFNQFGTGLHAYGSSRAFVQNYSIHHNVLFNNGILARDGRADNIFLGSGGSLSGIRVEDNLTYHTPSADQGASRIGWQFGGVNRDVVLRGNYFIGGYLAFELNSWSSAQVDGNVTYAARSYNVNYQPPTAWRRGILVWDNNQHYGSGQFLLHDHKVDPDGWRAAGLDQHGEFRSGPPSGVWSFLRRSDYDSNRATLTVYNWDLEPTVCADLSVIWPSGRRYRAFDAQNVYAPPVASGPIQNGPACLPMTGLQPAPPLGDVPNPPAPTAPEFAVFVILQD